jgi:hypothetical protein
VHYQNLAVDLQRSLAPIVARSGRTAAGRVNEAVVWTARVAAVLLMLLVEDGTDGGTSTAPNTSPHSDSITPILVIPGFSIDQKRNH